MFQQTKQRNEQRHRAAAHARLSNTSGYFCFREVHLWMLFHEPTKTILSTTTDKQVYIMLTFSAYLASSVHLKWDVQAVECINT